MNRACSPDLMPEVKTAMLFNDLKKDLNVSSCRRMAKIIERIFSVIRMSMSLKDYQALIASVPSLLQLHLINSWKQTEQTVNLTHLDELVEIIYKKETDSTDPVFRCEIDVLSAVVLTLQKLDNLFGLLNLKGFKFPLVQEVRQISLDYKHAI